MSKLSVVVAALLLICGVSGYAIAQSGGAKPKTVKACAKKKGGALRLAKRCRRGERRVTWSMRGPTGLTGPAGPQGAPGAAGIDGAQGPPGANGVNGTNGTSTGQTFFDSAGFGANFGGGGGACEASPAGPSITVTVPGGSYAQVMASVTAQRAAGATSNAACVRVDGADVQFTASSSLAPETRYLQQGNGAGTTNPLAARPLTFPLSAGSHTISLTYGSTGGTSNFSDRDLYVTVFHPTELTGAGVRSGGSLRLLREPAAIVDDLERRAELPPGSEERFFGYGVMGLPFRTGHVLGLRRFPASSIGPGYRSVWHRDPTGRWTFYQDQPAELACTRYFGADVDEVRQGPIEIDWTGPARFEVRAGDGDLEWMVEVGSTPVTRVLNSLGSMLPSRAWRSGAVLAIMSRVAGVALRAGRVRLAGIAPNGQRFVANPLTIWVATSSRATVGGEDLGEMGPAPGQAHLRDFAIPQRGVFVVGRVFFTDAVRTPSRMASM
jgi:hypothetical protein